MALLHLPNSNSDSIVSGDSITIRCVEIGKENMMIAEAETPGGKVKFKILKIE